MKCTNCNVEIGLVKKIANGIEYEVYECQSCKEEIMTKEQAKAYMLAYEKSKTVTVSRWGEALAIRIPAEIARILRLKPNDKARVYAKKGKIEIVPQ